MAGIGAGFSKLRPLCNSMNHHSRLFQSHNAYSTLARHDVQTLLRSSYMLVNRDHGHDDLKLGGYVASAAHCYSTALPVSSNLRFKVAAAPFVSLSPFLIRRSYSSSSGGNSDKFGVSEAASGGSNAGAGDSSVIGSDLVDKVKDSLQSAVDAVAYTGQKAKEVSDGLTPYAEQVLDSYPYLKNVIVPAGATLTGTVLAWVLLPKILRRFHKYSLQTPAALLSGGTSGEQIPYEQSFWCALENPMRCLITFMAFSQMLVLVAPNTVASVSLAEAWRGAFILSLMWFLQKWKTNVISRVLTAKSLVPTDREKILTLDRFSSVGLFAIGGMALAEACGVAVQSILTVGGVGGVATAFAARDILGNVLSGLSMHFSRPFSLGDTIKAGSIEGQVVEMGLTTTSLLSAEKFPIIVPNSMFSSQAIVNKSRAKWRSVINKIPMTIDDVEKIPQISSEIKSMMKSNPSVFLEREAPYCFLSRIESSFAELTLGCNLRSMSKEELYSTQQEILLQSVRILKEHGAKLGSSGQDTITQ